MTDIVDRPDLETWALDLADHMARRSKDPGRKVGAVILRPDNTIASAGYNGFSRRVSDHPDLLGYFQSFNEGWAVVDTKTVGHHE